MRCDVVQTELLRDELTPDVRDAVATHIATCDRCTRVRDLLEHMDVALRRGPVWSPPKGFAQRTALRGSRLVVEESARPPQRLVRRDRRAAVLGVLVAGAGYLGASALGALAPEAGGFLSDGIETALDAYMRVFGIAATTLVANASLLAWTSAGLSLWVAMRVTRGPLI